MANDNGFDFGPSPVQRRDAALRAREEREASRRKRTEQLQREHDQLVQKRLALRMEAAESAGAIGLHYCSDTNSFTRIVRSDASEMRVWQPVPRPEPLAPPQTEAPPTMEPPAVPKPPSKWLDGVLWAFVVVIGALVGLGLLTLVGFSWRRDPWVIPVGVVLGTCVLGGLKILVSTLWSHVGRESVLGGQAHFRTAVATLVTLGGCALDAHLGALAMHEYIRARELTEATVPPYGQLFALALAITCPLLLASGARAYRAGRAEPTAEERAASYRLEQQRKLEAASAQAEARLLEHQTALGKRIQDSYEDEVEARADLRRRTEAEDTQREAEWDALKGSPEFRCLQGLISQIGVLTNEIAERTKALNRESISEGYERTRQRREEDARNSRTLPWVENRRPEEAEEGSSASVL